MSITKYGREMFPSFISPSQLDLFSICPFLFMMRYTHQIEEEVSHILARGQVFHQAMNMHFTTGKSFYEIFRSSEFIQMAAERYDRVTGPLTIAEVEHDFNLIQEWVGIALDELEDNGIEVKESEMEVRDYIDGVPIYGIIDVLGKGGEIVDFKTGVRLKSPKDVRTSVQLAIYAMIVNKMQGVPIDTPRRVAFITLGEEGGEARGKFIDHTLGPEDYTHVRALLQNINWARKTGFYPNVARNKCVRWCPLYNTCHKKLKENYTLSGSAIVPVR